MRKLFIIILACCCLHSQGQLLKKIGDKVKEKTANGTKRNDNPRDEQQTTEPRATPPDTTIKKTDAPPALKVYANYDFVPGSTILFEDQFTDDRDGEFPSHWDLENGQAILNKHNGTEAFFLTDGNYCIVTPRTKTKSYLPQQFTVEYDTYNPGNAAYPLLCFLRDKDGNDLANIQAGPTHASWSGERSLTAAYPVELADEHFKDKWHHIAIVYRDKQVKIYVDQYRVLVVPNTGVAPAYVNFGGIGNGDNPIIFKNVRIAAGGDMNMIGKKFTDTRIITHGITFDYNKSVIKPESMGTLNMIVQVMKDNPEIKFEVGGHSDADGSDTYNLTLSQQRAEAVRDQLIKMGIEASRLTSRGYGETRPISDNTSLEGKANNRRVEFVKL